MSLESTVKALSAKYFPLGGQVAGEEYDQTRPSVVGTAIVHAPIASKKWRMENGYKDLPQPLVNGAAYYSGYGPFKQLAQGDVFTRADGSAPRLTFMHFYTLQGMCLINMERTGGFYNGEDPYLTNVPYSWLDSASATPVEDLVLAGQMESPMKRLVCWAWAPLLPHQELIQGLRFIETDGGLEVRWVVAYTQYRGRLIVFTVRREG
jgi:hypothetical protein